LKACNYVQSIARIAARQTRVRDAKLRIFPNSAYFLVCGYPHTRNNWLFAGSLRAGQRAAAVMSLIHSARLNGHDVYAYLKDILERLPAHPATRVAELLPHRWTPG
jgi:hypothetical protein